MPKWTMVLLTLLLVGCSKVNQENYDKLELGMSKQEVEAVIGGSDECSTTLGTETCEWGDDTVRIKVGFAGDHAILYTQKGLK